MKLIKNEQLDKNKVKLTIEIDKEAFEDAMNKSYKKNVKYINIPGFRKGKAPRHLVERYYGEGVFYEDAINFVCPDAYEFAVKEAGIEPVERPEIDIEEIGEGKETVITATVTTKPEVELGEYLGVKVEKNVYETNDEDIEKQIKADQSKNARMIPVEDRAVKMGDSTVIDFEGFVDGKAFDGGKAEDYTLVIGSGSFIPGFEDGLVGAEIGKETEVNVKFPEDYHSDELKGKDATFKVTVKEINEEELPELNDEFAKDVSEFDTFDEYKKDIKDKLDKANEERTKAEFENNVLAEVTKNATVDIPDCMVDARLDDMLRDFDYRLSAQGMNLEQYMKITGSTVDSFKEQFKDQAAEQVKMNLVLEAIAKKENIEVSDDEIEDELKKMAEAYNMEIDKVKTLIGDAEKESLAAEIKTRKAVKLVTESAKEKKARKSTKKADDAEDAEKKPAKKTTKKAAESKDEPAKKTTRKKKTEDKEDK